MTDRPEGDRLDQLLRKGITALAESAGPDETDAMVHEPAPIENHDRPNRGGLLAMAACLLALVIGAAFWLSQEPSTTLDVGGEETENDADPWAAFLDASRPEDQVRCLVEWNLNRDLFFRIPGDQFAVSTTVSSFPVDTPSALRWLDRFEPGLRILRSVALDDGQRSAIDEVLTVFGTTRASADGAERVDIAPAIVAVSNRLDDVFTHDAACPLGPSAEERPTHRALVAASAGDTQPLLSGVECVDAELDRLGGSVDPAVLAVWIDAGPLGGQDLDVWRSENTACPFANSSW